jgi:hypothetical protein
LGAPITAISRDGEAHSPGVSWGAVIGGAFAASSLYLILLALGAGFGLSVISPWSSMGASRSTVSSVAIVWLIVIEILASAFGGYLAGRLRIRWTAIHTDEVFFRDTANGFLAWAVALIVSVAFLASAATSMAGAAQDRTVTQGIATGTITDPAMLYYTDALFRTGGAAVASGDMAARSEAARILSVGLAHKEMSVADQSYLIRLVSTVTGMDQTGAARRVSDVLNEARQTEDLARKGTAHFLLWLFLSLLLGALSASYAATIGGKQRDHVQNV